MVDEAGHDKTSGIFLQDDAARCDYFRIRRTGDRS
jgi:hypothetical protein